MVSVVISPVSFLILFLGDFSLFFLMRLLKGVLILFIFSYKQLLDLLIVLWIVLLVSLSFNSAPILIIFFLLFTLAFVFIVLLVLVDVWAGCLFEVFLSFLGRPVLPCTSLSGLPLLRPLSFGLLCVHFNLFPETFSLLSSHC